MLTDEEKRRIEAEEEYRASVRSRLETRPTSLQSFDQKSDDSSPIYKRDDITITKTLVRFGNQSYPTNSIGSVSVKNADLGKPLSVAVICGFIFYATEHGFFLAVAIIAGLLALAQLWRGQLVIVSNSATHVALVGGTKNLQIIKAAIEKAVALRG